MLEPSGTSTMVPGAMALFTCRRTRSERRVRAYTQEKHPLGRACTDNNEPATRTVGTETAASQAEARR